MTPPRRLGLGVLRGAARAVTVLLLLASRGYAQPISHAAHRDGCATGDALDRDLAERERAAAARRSLLGGPAVSALGGLIVIDDDGSLTDSNEGSVFDLDRTTLDFDPVSGSPGAFLARKLEAAFDPDLGRLVATFGASWDQVQLPLEDLFPFGDGLFETAYATSDIGLFFQPQPPSATGYQYSRSDLFSSDEPRITPLLRFGPWIWGDLIDLYLNHDSLTHVTTITWHERTTRPESNPHLDRHFQVRLHASGRIEITYPDAKPFCTFGAVQVVSSGPPGPTLEDVSTLSTTPTPVRHVRQAFTFPALLPYSVFSVLNSRFGFDDENLDAIAIYQTFYTDITFYAGAYHTNGSSGAEGVGTFGPKATSLLHMNQIDLSWNLRDDGSRMSVLSHELGHRWLYFVGGVGDSRSGPHPAQNSHLPARFLWWTSDDASCMGGTRWTDNGDGTFASPAYRTYYSYSPIELYLMGFMPPENVEPWWYVGNQPALEGPYYPPVGSTFSGTRVDLSVDDVIAVEGPRIPAYPDTQRDFRMAFVLLTRQADPADVADLANVRHKMSLFAEIWPQTVGHEATIETELDEILAIAEPDCDFDGVADGGQIGIRLDPHATTVSPGGSLPYDVTVTNFTDAPRSSTAWIDVILPSGNPYVRNPIVGPRAFGIGARREVTRPLRIRVSASARPSGPFTVRASLGTPGVCIEAESSFTFTVVP